MHLLDVLFLVIVVAFTVVCLVWDVRTRRIPNWLTVPVFGLGLLAHTVFGGWTGLKFSLLGFGTGFGVLFALWVIGGGGGGDVKMMGALGAWLGSWLTVEVFIASAVVTIFIVSGGILYAAATGRNRKVAKDKKKAAGGNVQSPARRVLPYAVPLSVGTWAVLAYACSSGGSLLETLY
jgi:prepilin peptidase CpaA